MEIEYRGSVVDPLQVIREERHSARWRRNLTRGLMIGFGIILNVIVIAEILR